MPRLTRTQKFADLRESLANDKESSLQTKDLSSYESRLNNITGEEIRPQETVRETVPETPKEDPKYVWTPFEDTTTEAENAEDVIDLTITDLWNSARIGEEKKEEPVVEPVYEEAPVEEKIEETVSEPVVEETPVIEEPAVTETPAVEPAVEEKSTEEAVTDYILEDPFAEFDEILSEKYAKEEKKEETEVAAEPVTETVQEEPVVEEIPLEEKIDEIFTVPETTEEKVEQFTEETPIFAEPEGQTVEEPVFAEPEETVVEETPVIEEPTVEEPIIEEPTVEETPVFEEPVIEDIPVVEEPVTVAEGPTYEEVPVQEEEKELDADEVETEPVVEENPYLGFYQPNPEVEAAYEEAEKLAAQKAAEEEAAKAEAEKEETVVEEVPVFEEPVVEETPVVEEPVREEEPVNEEVAELVEEEPVEVVEEPAESPAAEVTYDLPADNHMPENVEEGTSGLIHETISEVDKYNEENGDLTIHTLTSNMVNEIRHGESAPTVEKEPVIEERPVEKKPVEEFVEVPIDKIDENEEEFSNTVSMEISKIMNEVAENKDANEIPVEEVAAPVVEEHPVLTKALEEEPEEEVVEIRNLNELDEEPVQNTLSNTIPFVVAPSNEEEVIDEEVEEDSNTILNIILIILIVILVAVLGLIIFYILKTKGII